MMRVGEAGARDRGRWAVAGALLLTAWMPLRAAEASGRPDRDDHVVLHDVAVRPGVTADISFTVFVNERHPCEGRDVLAVPGFAHTAATFKPLAEALFADSHGQKACRIIAVDLPGHGGSSLPAGIPFGLLTLDDDVRVLQAALERLPAHGLRPRAILGHSQGGLLVQMLQQALAGRGRAWPAASVSARPSCWRRFRRTPFPGRSPTATTRSPCSRASSPPTPRECPT